MFQATMMSRLAGKAAEPITGQMLLAGDGGYLHQHGAS